MSHHVVDFFGMRYAVPVVSHWKGTVVAVNVGGAVIPTLMSIYLLIRRELWVKGLVATAPHLTLVPRDQAGSVQSNSPLSDSIVACRPNSEFLTGAFRRSGKLLVWRQCANGAHPLLTKKLLEHGPMGAMLPWSDRASVRT